MTVAEIREYRMARRRVLILCLINSRRSAALDDLTIVFIKSIQKLNHRAKVALQQWLSAGQRSSEELLLVFNDVLQTFNSVNDPDDCHAKVQQRLNRAGGVPELIKGCEARLEYRVGQWQDFVGQPYRSQRSMLLNILVMLPLRSMSEKSSVLAVVQRILQLRSERALWISLDIDERFLGSQWASLVCHPEQKGVYQHRSLEIAVLFGQVAGLRAGELFIEGGDKFSNYQEKLFDVELDPVLVESVLNECSLPTNSDAFIDELKTLLSRASRGLELAVSHYECVQLDKSGRPIVSRPFARSVPASAEKLAVEIKQRVPDRAILEALYNTDRWAGWTRHFGPPSRVSAQLDDPTMRYVLTAFTYGCGLGPTQASRHFDKPVPEHLLRFVNRRHVSVENLRAACTDMINLYDQFDLPACWGQGTAAAADGSLVETYDDNLLASYHVRYQRTGGIAYRHVADNYVALFSQFVVCGVYEAGLYSGRHTGESINGASATITRRYSWSV